MRLPRELRRSLREAGRRALVFGCLVAFLVASVGFPIPRPADPNDKPYPCQAHACGCQSAESCWRHCCCFDAQQKLAWARVHGVMPPPWLVAEADDNAEHEPADDAADARGDESPAPPVVICCEKQDKNVPVSPTVGPPNSAPVGHGWEFVSAVNYGKCVGWQSLWTVSDIGPVPPIAEYHFQLHIIELLVNPSERADSSRQPPPTRPPNV
jgi:hypothetical protein